MASPDAICRSYGWSASLSVWPAATSGLAMVSEATMSTFARHDLSRIQPSGIWPSYILLAGMLSVNEGTWWWHRRFRLHVGSYLFTRVLVGLFFLPLPALSSEVVGVPAPLAYRSSIHAAFGWWRPRSLTGFSQFSWPRWRSSCSFHLSLRADWEPRWAICRRPWGDAPSPLGLSLHPWKHGRRPSEWSPHVIRQSPGAPITRRLLQTLVVNGRSAGSLPWV